MIFLLGSILFGSLFSITFKVCQNLGIDGRQVIFFNYLFAGLASWIPMGIQLASGSADITDFSIHGSSWVFGIIQGILFVTGFTLMNRSIWRSGVALTTVAARASLIMPVILGWLVLSQPAPKWIPVIGILTSIFLIFLPTRISAHKDKRTERTDEQRRKRAILALFAVFACYGISDFWFKLSQNSVETQFIADNHLSSHFDALTGLIFFSAAVGGLISYLLRGNVREHPITWKGFAGGIILGTINVLCTMCQMRALTRMSTGEYYPLYNIGTVLIAVIAGVLFFKEKLKWPQYIGIALAIFCIILFFR